MPASLRRPGAALVLAALTATVAWSASATYAQGEDRERTLIVSAVTSKGAPVESLSPDDVVVREDGARREVLRVSRATEPLDIALLIDNSAASRDAMLQLRGALRAFVGYMAGTSQIAIITLADRPTIAVDYTSDVPRLEAAAGRIFPMASAGMTLLDAVVEVSRGLRRRETPRAVIVPVITDGVEFSNRYHRDVIAAAQEAGASVHAITIGTFRDITSNIARERALVLDQGTKVTGGQRIELLTPMGLDAAFTRLARELLSQYKVVYARPQTLIPPRTLEVQSARAGTVVRGAPMRGQPGA